VYAPDGTVRAVRHAWTFDPAYSSYVTQGLDKNGDGVLTPDELQDLARENAESLADFDYFTVLKANGAKAAFAPPRDYRMTFENGQATLAFELPLTTPARTGRTLTLEVNDPSWFVSFTLAEGADAVRLADAPKGCAATVIRPKPLQAPAGQQLSEAFFQSLNAAQSLAADGANRIIVACP